MADRYEVDKESCDSWCVCDTTTPVGKPDIWCHSSSETHAHRIAKALNATPTATTEGCEHTWQTPMFKVERCRDCGKLRELAYPPTGESGKGGANEGKGVD